MKNKLLPWENPDQNYHRSLAKRQSERRYRVLQLAKTLRLMLTRFKILGVEDFNSEIVGKIDSLEKDAGYLDDEEFQEAKKYVTKLKRQLEKLENEI